jgi:hypothetical protein
MARGRRPSQGFRHRWVRHDLQAVLRAWLAHLRAGERGEGYVCPSCRRKVERPENFLGEEFGEWLKEFEGGGTPLKVGRLLICPPRVKAGPLAPP